MGSFGIVVTEYHKENYTDRMKNVRNKVLQHLIIARKKIKIKRRKKRKRSKSKRSFKPRMEVQRIN
jgi:hypothetical protein